MELSHYEALGIEPWADERRIAKAYRAAARKTHPDGWAGADPDEVDELSHEMASLNEARRVLSDPLLRALYDKEIGITPSQRKVPVWVAPPCPEGFGVYPHARKERGDYQFARFADEQHRALSLISLTGDLSSLQDVAADGVWKLIADRPEVGDEDLRHISRMSALQFLDLTDARITDAGLVHLLPLRGLDDLNLSGTMISDEGMLTIGKMQSIGCLSIGRTSISDEGLKPLSALSGLDTLDIRSTSIRGPGLKYLFGLEDLDQVRMTRRVDRAWRRRLKQANPRITFT